MHPTPNPSEGQYQITTAGFSVSSLESLRHLGIMGRTKKQPAESAPKAKIKAKAKASSAQISPLLDAENNAMLASSGTLVENQFPNNFVDWLNQVWLSFINKADCGSGRDFYLI